MKPKPGLAEGIVISDYDCEDSPELRQRHGVSPKWYLDQVWEVTHTYENGVRVKLDKPFFKFLFMEKHK